MMEEIKKKYFAYLLSEIWKCNFDDLNKEEQAHFDSKIETVSTFLDWLNDNNLLVRPISKEEGKWIRVEKIVDLWKFVEAQREIIMKQRDEPRDNPLMGNIERQMYTIMANTLADTMDAINDCLPPSPETETLK